MVVWRWLDNIPLVDPIERKLAPILQLAFIGILVGFLANLLIEGLFGEVPPDIAGGAIFLAICLAAFVLLRRGNFKVAVWILMIVLVLGNNTRLMRAPVEDADEALLTFFLPLTIAGILLGRRVLIGLFAVICLIIASPDNADRLGTVTVFVFILNAALVSFLVDLMGRTLRNELRAARTHNEELEQAQQAIEASSAELFKLNERLTITLKSIGDAVITTDADVRITLLNGVAEQLTGWTQAEAEGQPLRSVFHIINEETREIVESPADKVMREGVTVGLANHTVLIAKDGREIPIDDSGAPIIDNQGAIAGVVLVFRDITERKATEIREAEIVASNERQRFARELHDSVSQTLFATSVIAASLPNLFKTNPERGFQQLVEIQALTRGAMAEMRTLLLELRPENVAKMSLGDLLHQLANVAQARQKIAVSILLEGDDTQTLPEAVHFALYRIAQETLNNIVRHGNVRQVRIRLNRTPENAELIIVDSGQGFDVSQVNAGRGLASMRERAASINAILSIQSKIGLGTRTKIVWKQ
jgi:PAS domain S-box-containing protein